MSFNTTTRNTHFIYILEVCLSCQRGIHVREGFILERYIEEHLYCIRQKFVFECSKEIYKEKLG